MRRTLFPRPLPHTKPLPRGKNPFNYKISLPKRGIEQAQVQGIFCLKAQCLILVKLEARSIYLKLPSTLLQAFFIFLWAGEWGEVKRKHTEAGEKEEEVPHTLLIFHFPCFFFFPPVVSPFSTEGALAEDRFITITLDKKIMIHQKRDLQAYLMFLLMNSWILTRDVLLS